MKADASISVRATFHPDPLGDGHSGYTTIAPETWHGGPVAEIDTFDLYARQITRSATLPPVGSILRWGRWRLAVVAHGALGRSIYVTRDLRWARWYALRWRLEAGAALTKARIIATAAIWGLGRYSWAAGPTWDQIHAVAWAKARWHALRDRPTGR